MRRLVATLAAALATAGCGGSAEERALAETAENLGEIRSGVLELRVLVESTGTAEGEAGFALEGPFALPDEGELPVANVTYTRIAEGEVPAGTFVSTGRAAYVVVRGTPYRLPREREDALRAQGDVAGLEELEIGDWFADAEQREGPRIDGVETTRVRSPLDVVAALSDIGDLTRDATGGASPLGDLTEEDAEQIERAVRAASVELLTGEEDRLLRQLRLDVRLAPAKQLPPHLRNIVGVRFRLDLAIRRPNRPVRVAAPTGARPPSEFPGG